MGLVRAGEKNATGPCPHPGPKHTEVPPVTNREQPDPVALVQKAILELASPGDARPRPQTPLTPGQQAAALRAMPYIADALAGLCELLREAGSGPDVLCRGALALKRYRGGRRRRRGD